MRFSHLLGSLAVTLSAFAVCAHAQTTITPPPTATPTPVQTASNTKLTAAKGSFVVPPEKANPVTVPKFDKPPVIDGKLDDEVWKTAAVLKDFYQIQPGDNVAPSKPTEVLLGYDAKFLYIAFKATDEPDKVRATVAKRDNIFQDDYVGLFLDTFNDKRKAFEAFFNPLGIQGDGIITEGRGEDMSIDLLLESKGIIHETGFNVEVAIPFKSLRFEAGKGKLWGAHFFRRIQRFESELDSWMPFSRSIDSNLSQAGHLTGLEGISVERTIELIPSLTVSQNSRFVPSLPATQRAIDPGRIVNEPVGVDLGLTATFIPSSAMTIDFALNPDFAQVEADQLVVTANQRFPIFFPEKRPFFLEGIDIFNTQIAAVHTRTIVDPDFAVKLTGKTGRNTFGLLAASDNAPGNFTEDEKLTANSRLIGKNASVGVVRLKRDIGTKDSFIGFLGTYRKFVDQYNELAGLDAKFRINKQTTLSAQVLGTHSREFFFYPDLGKTLDRAENGIAYATDYNMSDRHWGYDYSSAGLTRFYRADVGFNRRVNTN